MMAGVGWAVALHRMMRVIVPSVEGWGPRMLMLFASVVPQWESVSGDGDCPTLKQEQAFTTQPGWPDWQASLEPKHY